MRRRWELLSCSCLSLVACGGEEVEEELLLESAGEIQASIRCEEREERAYDHGALAPIRVVSVDGRPVEFETANAFSVMRDAAEVQGVALRVLSGFRTNEQQAQLYECYLSCSCNSCNRAARPGYSNHQNGHALDLYTSAGVVSWLRANGHRFGFSETVRGEPWHWEWWGGGPGGGPCTHEPPPAPPTGCGVLGPGQAMGPGQVLSSCSSTFQLAIQADGNVVQYQAGRALWATGTDGRSIGTFVMQGDGNLVLYSSTGEPLWDSGTHGQPGAYLINQDDGNVVVYSAYGRALWATDTVQSWSEGPATTAQPPPTCGRLGSDASLRPGEFVRSCNGRYLFVHQADGNVVLYDEPAATPLFHTGTHGQATRVLVMQGDGNLVLYGAGALWDSRTPGSSGSVLAVQDDGNVVIYTPAGRPIWATHTQR